MGNKSSKKKQPKDFGVASNSLNSNYKTTNNKTGIKPPTSSTKETDINELKGLFRQFDIDDDGFIEEHELRAAMQKMGVFSPDDEIRKMFQSADFNNDGKISFEEFVHIASASPLTLSYKSVFHQLDRDGDGEITKIELKTGFASMGHSLNDKEVDAIFRDADVDHDGKINFDEFVVMMSKKK